MRPGRHRRKDAQRIVTAQVTATGDHFLRGDRVPVGQADARANAKRIAAAPAQPHRHPRPVAFIAVQPRRLVQVVDDHVLVAVVVEIGQRHPV